MPRLTPSAFSKTYSVQRLDVSALSEMLALCDSNPQYYAYCGKALSEALLRSDLSLLPPNKRAGDKYYVGFYAEDRLIAMLDLIDGYPDADTAYIGFFMLHGSMQGHGIGSRIIDDLFAYLSEAGFSRVRLGIDRDNPQSMHFWQKNGFLPQYEVSQESGIIVVADRRL